MTFDEIKAKSLASGSPVAILFYGAACGPCAALKPVLRKTCADTGVELAEINIAGDMDAVRALGVRAVPTVMMLAGETAETLFMGNQPEPVVRKKIGESYAAAALNARKAD